jgi:hypothetical protein
MKYGKFFVIILALTVQIYSCKKSSNTVTPTVTPQIFGNWGFSSEADTLFYIPKIMDTTFTKSSYLNAYINFLSDGTVYTSTSFVTGTGVFGNSMFFSVLGFDLSIIDTSKYIINNNVITFTPKYGDSYKDSIITLDNNRLILSRSLSSVYKKVWNYSR